MKGKMANSKIVFDSILSQLTEIDSAEAYAMAALLLWHDYRLSLSQILSGKEIVPKDYSEIISRINQHEPIQYILGEADFYGRTFIVNPSVLIPRPETELLIAEIKKYNLPSPKILDVGTGSGCIAITLKKEIPSAQVYALDVSAEALRIAKVNAARLQADIHFLHNDFLKHDLFISEVDILVSNPPYVAKAEQNLMKENVLHYEPHLALFVADSNPLIFYQSIAEKSKDLLKPNGKIFVEINEKFGAEVKQLFEQAGFVQTKIVKDIDSKDRVVMASRH